MVNFCCVAECKNEYYPGCGFSFHRFPRDESMREKWSKVVPGKIVKTSLVCSKKFEVQDYDSTSRKILKSHARPFFQSQIQWLKAAGRDDLLDRDQKKLTASNRFCSRHFSPSSIKNRHLCPDACPTLCIPGTHWSDDESEEEAQAHDDIVCNSCSDRIVGFRYKCVSCQDFDLCQKCEMLESHPNHYMLRIPKPMKFKLADNLITKWRKLFKSEHITPDCNDNDNDSDDSVTLLSSDDEPITKYAKNYDSGIDLSEDIKNKIRKEVTRVLKVNRNKTKEKPVKPKVGKKFDGKRTASSEDAEQAKRMKFETDVVETNTPELVFADVNEIKDDLKGEFSPLINVPRINMSSEIIPVDSSLNGNNASTILDIGGQQPVMHVKLSDDLSELMIEVTSNNQKTFYKYSDGPPQ